MPNDFDDIPTVVVARETMRQVIYGEGHAPAGPDRPTRNIKTTPIDFDLSDGVPVAIEHDATTEPHRWQGVA